MNKVWLADCFQRVVTLNKVEQKRKLEQYLAPLGTLEGKRVLDFGCGTALFAPFFLQRKADYTGYDIDSGLTDYAAAHYAGAAFTCSKERLLEQKPFDLILMNCCSHHIEDSLLAKELEFLRDCLSPDGVFVFIDIIKPQEPKGLLHKLARRLIRRMELGAFWRSTEDQLAFLAPCFSVENTNSWRSHFFSLSARWNLLHNDMNTIVCRKKS